MSDQDSKSHGRIESRQCYIFGSNKLEGDFSRWAKLKSIVMVENFRFEKGKKLDLEYRYYISSKELTAEQAANAVREHWGIESMHWVLDVSMNEDACQIYKAHGAETKHCIKWVDRLLRNCHLHHDRLDIYRWHCHQSMLG